MTADDAGGAGVLSPTDLARLSEFIYRHTGMIFGESKRYYIERRVAERIAATGEPNFRNYFAFLRADAAEAELLINSFAVNETYFYRELHQLKCLSTDILPEIVRTKRPGDRVRIWSVPCSTGDEPYSIAIWLLENWRFVDAYNVEIVGSDIDTAALRAAVDADYNERALARLPAPLVERYFERPRGDRRRLIQDLRESVTFEPVNIVDAATMRAQGKFDVIFCRNVLIYFDDRARALAVDNLYHTLLPGGFICLGHTESMARISDRFVTARYDDAVVYRRAA